jgi:hypothetical protein
MTEVPLVKEYMLSPYSYQNANSPRNEGYSIRSHPRDQSGETSPKVLAGYKLWLAQYRESLKEERRKSKNRQISTRRTGHMMRRCNLDLGLSGKMMNIRPSYCER